MEEETKITDCHFSALLVLSPAYTTILSLDEFWRPERSEIAQDANDGLTATDGLLST